MRYEVVYDDGTIKEYKVKPRHLVRHEIETKRDGDNLIAKSYKLSWMASGSTETFAEWLDTVDDVQALDFDVSDGSSDPEGSDEVVPTRSPSRGSQRR